MKQILLFVTLLTFFSCKKQDNGIENNQNKNQIRFNIGGITNFEQENLFATTRNTDHSIVENTNGYSNEIDLGDNTMFVSSETSALGNLSSPKDVMLSREKSASTSLMGINVVYRVLIYERSGGNWAFYTHKDIVSGKNDPPNNTVQLVLGSQYKWVAYSYGTTSITDTPPTKGSTTFPIIQTKHDSPTLYCPGGEFENTASVTTQTVLFTHKTSKLEVVVDTRGLFADNGAFVKNITSASANLLPQGKVTTTTLNLQSGTLGTSHTIATGFNVAKPLTIDTDLEDVDGFLRPQTYQSAKVSSTPVYTSLAPNAANFSVTLNQLSVTRSVGFANDADSDSTTNIGDGATSTLITASNALTNAFSSSTTSNTVGKLLRLNFRLGDKGVLLNGTYWSKGNLYFRTTGGSGSALRGEYRIDRVRKRSTGFKNSSTAHRHYYWRYNKLYPFNIIPHTNNNNAANGDPCTRLHPRGVWRTPNRQDYINIVQPSTGVTSPSPSPASLSFQRYWDGVSPIPTTNAASNSHLVIRVAPISAPSTEGLFLNAIGHLLDSNNLLQVPTQGGSPGLDMNTLNNPFVNEWGFKVYFTTTVNSNRFSFITTNGGQSATFDFNLASQRFGTGSGHSVRCVRN